MNCLGIDPGSNSVGLCYWCTGSAIRFARVNKSASTKRSDVERDIDFINRIADAMRALNIPGYIHAVVLEEPKDAQTHWSAGKGGPMAVGSLFAMGKGYGLCLAAIAQLTKMNGYTVQQFVAYQVKSNKHGEGWQPRFKVERRPKGSPRVKGSPHKDKLLEQLRTELAWQWSKMPTPLGEPRTPMGHAISLSEHELMAFGVLSYHLAKPRV